jgi:hypothetical protein
MSNYKDKYESTALSALHKGMRNRSANYRVSAMISPSHVAFADELRDVCDTIIIRCCQLEAKGVKMADDIYRTAAKVDPETGRVVTKPGTKQPILERIQMSVDEVKDSAWRCMEQHKLLLK